MFCSIFFSESSSDPLPDVISNEAMAAAIDFVEVCTQQTAFIAGRDTIEQELKLIVAGDEHW